MAGQTINVSILADTKQFSSAMKKLSDESGLTKLGAGFKSAGEKVAGFMKTGMKWTAALGAGIAALALKGGFDRALNIEDARAQLGALGHDATKIDGIMANALASVKGTAFGLGDAATLAGQAVAAGIQPGEQLEKQLKLVTNTAALAKTGMGEMGSIFQKVWTAGRVGTEELNQLADRGIPIWTKLQEHYGVTAEELRKMVSQGKIDAESFADVLENTVGPAGEAMGNTTRGAFANMKAALSRAGESFLTGVFPLFKEGLGGITGMLDGLAPIAEKAGGALAGWMNNSVIPSIKNAIPAVKEWMAEMRDRLTPVITDLKERWENELRPALERVGGYITGTIIPALQGFAAWLADNREKVAAVAVVIAAFVGALMTFNQITAIIQAVSGAFAALNAVMLANPIGLIVAAIAALVAGLALFFTQTETGRVIWETFWTFIKDTAAGVADWFTATVVPALQTAWEAIVAAGQAAATWYQEHLAPVFQAVAELVAAAASRISEVLAAAWSKVQEVWSAVGGPVMAAVGVAVTLLRGIWSAAWTTIQTVTSAAWTTIQTVINTALGVVRGVISSVTAAIKGDWSGAWNEIRGVASTIWQGIKTVVSTAISAVQSVIRSALTAIRSAWTEAWNSVKEKVSEAWDGIKSTVERKGQELLTWFKQLPSRIKGAVGNLGSTLKDAGRQLIDGFLGSISAGFQKVKAKLAELTSFLPAWKGPPSKDKTILKGAGSLVIQGFIDGLESQYGNVKSSLIGLTRDVSSTTFSPLPAPVAAYPGPASPDVSATSTGPSNSVTNVNFHPGSIQVSGLSSDAAVEDFARQLPALMAQYSR